MPAKTIITALTADHRKVASMLDALEKTSPRAVAKRKQLFAELDAELSLHAEFEEERVYPLLKDETEGKSLALEAVEEHAQVKRLLAELRELPVEDERWDAKLAVLAEDVRHHVKEEEREALPRLKKLAGGETLASLADEYRNAKTQGPAMAGNPTAASEGEAGTLAQP